MAPKAVPLEPMKSYRLDDPRRPAPAPPKPAAAPQEPAPQAPTVKRPQRREAAAAAPAETAASTNRDATSTEGVEQSSSAAMPAQADVVNPYGHAGRPHQVALSLYVPQWERIEEQCGELRARGSRCDGDALAFCRAASARRTIPPTRQRCCAAGRAWRPTRSRSSGCVSRLAEFAAPSSSASHRTGREPRPDSTPTSSTLCLRTIVEVAWAQSDSAESGDPKAASPTSDSVRLRAELPRL
jgi:hypothetical protein